MALVKHEHPLDKHTYDRACPNKHQSRLDTLNAVKAHPSLYSKGYLRKDWVELVALSKDLLPDGQPVRNDQGEVLRGGDLSFEFLRNEGVHQPDRPQAGNLIGVNVNVKNKDCSEDHARTILRINQEVYGSHGFQWLYGSMQDLCDQDAFPNAGVLVFDSFNSLSQVNYHKLLDPILRCFLRQAQRCGVAILAINLCESFPNHLAGHKSQEDARRAYEGYLRNTLKLPPQQDSIFTSATYKSHGHAMPMRYTRFCCNAHTATTLLQNWP